MTTITAAVSRGKTAPFTIETLSLDEPRADEVLVKIHATGLCHTDVASLEGGMPTRWPAVLGHEGAGIVEAVGRDVADVHPGDHVLLSFGWCGTCQACLAGRPTRCAQMMPLNFAGARPDGSTTMTAADGSAVHGRFFGQSSFATHALAPARNAVKVPTGIDFSIVAGLACTTQTGAGAILNTLRVTAGDRVVVSGVGACGMGAIMAARVAGATRIVAVDVLPARLEMALQLGATHAVDGRGEDALPQIRQALGGAADCAVDSSGVASAVQNDVLALALGGKIALIAGGLDGAALGHALTGKAVHYVIAGDAVPRLFVPRLLELYVQGRFPVDRIITTYPLAEIAAAVADTRTGKVTKAIIAMP